MRYEIIYDYCDEWTDECNLTEYFDGTWSELQAYLHAMRENGCYHFSVGCISEEL